MKSIHLKKAQENHKNPSKTGPKVISLSKQHGQVSHLA